MGQISRLNNSGRKNKEYLSNIPKEIIEKLNKNKLYFFSKINKDSMATITIGAPHLKITLSVINMVVLIYPKI